MILGLEGGLLAQAMIVALAGIAFLKKVWHEFWGLDTKQQIKDLSLSKKKSAITVQKQSGGN